MPVMPWSKGEQVPSGNPHLHIDNIREDSPQWGRRYVLKLDCRATLRIGAWSYAGKRRIDGELKQPDGKWISFQPEEIADKIIDRTLVPLVEAACDEILALDRAYMSSNRRRFTDESGTRWEVQSYSSASPERQFVTFEPTVTVIPTVPPQVETASTAGAQPGVIDRSKPGWFWRWLTGSDTAV